MVLLSLKLIRYIVIDVSLIHIHTDKTLKSLATQINLSYSTIKKKLGSYKLILYSSHHSRGIEILSKILGEAKITYFIGDFAHMIYMHNIYRPLYLDPYASQKLEYRDLLWSDAVILGGIVDKPKIKRLTTLLRNMNAPDIPARKIELKGSVVGVPEELNKIIDIVFDSLDLGSVEEAIKMNQSKRYIIARTIMEIQKSRKACYSKEIRESLYRELSLWMNLDAHIFKIALKKACQKNAI